MGDWWRHVSDAVAHDLAHLGNGAEFAQVLVRLLAAGIFGAVLGYQRERMHQAAGLRTHILVTMGAALFVLIIHFPAGNDADLSRVIQGVVTGIGFLGAGAIIKLEPEKEVHGLTTAAGIWLATAIGMAAGVGRLDLALPGTILAFFVLSVLRKIEGDSHHAAGPPKGKEG